jgi:hypothetical protein
MADRGGSVGDASRSRRSVCLECILCLIYVLAVADAGVLMRNPPEDHRAIGWQQ